VLSNSSPIVFDVVSYVSEKVAAGSVMRNAVVDGFGLLEHAARAAIRVTSAATDLVAFVFILIAPAGTSGDGRVPNADEVFGSAALSAFPLVRRLCHTLDLASLS